MTRLYKRNLVLISAVFAWTLASPIYAAQITVTQASQDLGVQVDEVSSPFDFETERTWVRLARPSDGEEYVKLLTDPEVIRMSGDFFDENLAENLAKMPRPTDLDHPRHIIQYSIFTKKNHEFVGQLQLANPRAFGEGFVRPDGESLDDTFNVGYSICKKFWGQGYATEVTKGAVQVVFKKIGFPKMVGITLQSNLASQKVLLKSGFRDLGEGPGPLEGQLTHYFALDSE